MKLIVGLGNPGLTYGASRHNIGFTVLKSLAGSLKVSFKRDNSVSSLVGLARLGRQDLILALPQTFMNLSGVAVKSLLKKFKAEPEDLLVVCDDLDLELGRMKIRQDGSSGGHRGLASIIEHLGAQEFCRLRIGIGRPPRQLQTYVPTHSWRGGRPDRDKETADYVLSTFTKKEKEIVREVKEKTVNCVLSWVEKGVAETMNAFNKKTGDKNRTKTEKQGTKTEKQGTVLLKKRTVPRIPRIFQDSRPQDFQHRSRHE